jgi:DNA repair exonuclease SbcCD ATPase subunit
MSMDLGQLTQMTTWLDEELRGRKAELTQVQQRLGGHEAELQDQARAFKELETRVAGMQSQLVQTSQLQSTLQQFKEEVVHLLAQADDRRKQEEREAERLRAVERDNLSRTINEIRRDLQRISRVEEESNLRKAEQQRMGDSLLGIQQKINALAQEVENKLRTVSFLDDSRQQAAKRIAQLQQESLEAMKRLEQQGSTLQSIGDVTQRQERDTGELKELVTQLRSSQRDFIEKQLLEAEQLKRKMTDWFEQLEAYARKMDQFTARMETFDETYRDDRQVVEGIQSFQEQIRRDQAQVAELQRLGEERQRRQLDEWQDENEKRWRKELLRWDHQWGEQAKRNAQFTDTLNTVDGRLSQHRAELDAAWRCLETQISYRAQEVRRWQGEMTRLLEERPKKE